MKYYKENETGLGVRSKKLLKMIQRPFLAKQSTK